MQSGVVIARSLKHELRFCCCDDEIYRRLKYVEATPVMSAVDLVPIEIAISRDTDKYCLSYG